MADIHITEMQARAMAREYWKEFKQEHEHECGFENNAPCTQCLYMMEGYAHGILEGASEQAIRSHKSHRKP